ncbi:MAG TPA: penicillin-binding protein 2 [Pyrinomonadaceae bacterium]|jgi:cell division protein FtsI/penicillin-binding protein 2
MPKRQTVNKKRNPAQTAFTRFLFIVAIFAVWIGIIGVRLVHLQVTQHEWLKEKALDLRRVEKKSKMLRGAIYDRSERALAMSVKVKSLFADPREIEDVEATAKAVAGALKIKPNDILKDLKEAKQSGKKFVWLARKIDESAAQKLNETLKTENLKKADEPKFAGLHWREEQKRQYPQGTLAAHIVGFSNSDDVGQAGIEQSQESALRGAVIEKWQDRDRLGRVYDESETEEREPPKDVYLTISNSIQYKVEQALKKGVEAARAKSGTAIVLDPKTGEVLAMANYPTFDPNKFNEAAPDAITNKAVQNLYSPGSVFKLVTYGGALEEKLIAPDKMFDCGGGVIKVGSREFADKHCQNSISYTEALAVSSNIGAIKTGQMLGRQSFYNYARQFGFGEPTGIELPAEAKGQIRSPESWFGDSLASMSIGYEINVTALQTAAAFATIANDGVRVKPHIIKEIRSNSSSRSDEKNIQTAEVERVPVVNAETARSLRRMLREVVLSGTGKRARLNGYTSAGKTGTAWKYDAKLKRVSGSKYVSSFIGFAPADNPSVVIAVVLDEPQGGARDGGQVSAPIFREIAEGVLPELNVVPDGTIQQDLTAENIPEETEIQLPSAINKSAEKTDKKIDENGAGKLERGDKTRESIQKGDKTSVEKSDKTSKDKKLTGEKEKLKSPEAETQKKEKSKTTIKNRNSISSHRFLKYKLIYENISSARRNAEVETFFERIEAKT